MAHKKNTPLGDVPGKHSKILPLEDSAGDTQKDAEARVSTTRAVFRKPIDASDDQSYVEHWGINE
jgi:hypothetical protein